MKAQYRAADERRWETISILVEKKRCSIMHTARDWQIYWFPRTFLTKFRCSGAMYSNSVIRRRSKFFHTQIQFSLSGDLFERKTDIQNRKTKKKFNTKLGTRFDACCRESTPHLLEMTAIVRMIRVSHTNDHITSLNSGWPLKKNVTAKNAVYQWLQRSETNRAHVQCT